MIQEHISGFFILTDKGKGAEDAHKPERSRSKLKETKPF
jgi:hypothetical protein